MICERVFKKSFLRFFGRELKEKQKRRLSSVLIRKLSFCSFLSRVKNTKATDKERRCFFQKTDVSQELLLSKNVFILVVFTNIKQSSLCSSSALCAETLFRLHSLRSLSLHFEEAFVVVVVSEEARFCLRSLFLVV